MRRLTLAAVVLLCAGCNCSPGTEQLDGGMDAGADAGSDGGSDAGSTFDAGRLTLPMYRLGPRSSFQGSFVQAPIAGSISLPVTATAPAGFAGWEISSAVSVGTVTLMTSRDDGGTRGVELSVTISTSTNQPQLAREIFTARSADAGTVLMAVLDVQRELHFTMESTALQALALAEVRAIDAILSEAYFYGVQPGDRPELDSHVPAVAAAMKLRFAADGKTGLSPQGFAFPGAHLFDVIDGARSTPGVFRPVVTAGETGLHVTEVALGGAEGTLALWIGAREPLPAIAVPAGTTRVAVFLYTVLPNAEPLYVKFATADGGQSAASSRFMFSEPLGPGPDSPTLTWDGGEARACDLTTGHHVVFFASGTEIAIGFAGATVPPGSTCVRLLASDLPPGVGLLTAAQIAPGGRVGAPSNIVFP